MKICSLWFLQTFWWEMNSYQARVTEVAVICTKMTVNLQEQQRPGKKLTHGQRTGTVNANIQWERQEESRPFRSEWVWLQFTRVNFCVCVCACVWERNGAGGGGEVGRGQREGEKGTEYGWAQAMLTTLSINLLPSFLVFLYFGGSEFITGFNFPDSGC